MVCMEWKDSDELILITRQTIFGFEIEKWPVCIFLDSKTQSGKYVLSVQTFETEKWLMTSSIAVQLFFGDKIN